MSINIQGLIEKYISSDDSFTVNNQKNILRIYNKLSPAERKNIDALFIELCGHSMDTILKELDTNTKRSIISEETL